MSGRMLIYLVLLAAALNQTGRAQSDAVRVANTDVLAGFQAASEVYQKKDYATAARLFEDVIQADRGFGTAYFFAANSYDNLFSAGNHGRPEDRALLIKAADYYRTAADMLTRSPRAPERGVGMLALQYLVAVCGREKLDDPARAAAALEQLVQLNPGEPLNYFTLARLREEAGNTVGAEAVLLRAREALPDDPRVDLQLAGYYNRRGEFEKAMEALRVIARKEPNNPEPFYMLGTYYWDQTDRHQGLDVGTKRQYVRLGLEALDRALELRPDYIEALIYKSLLVRIQATLETDRERHDGLIRQAEELLSKADRLKAARPDQRPR
jgi:tetratricopeptide (TPR) repeat protein